MEKISLIAPYSDGGLVIALGYRSWLKLLPQSCRMHKSAASGGALDDLIGAHVFRKAEWRSMDNCFHVVASLHSQ